MAQNLGSKLWGPFKELFYVVDGAVSKKNPDAYSDLEAALRKHKPDFVSLLQNPAKNAQHREQLRKANTEGVLLDGGTAPKILPVDVIEESLIISDLFDLNEYSSVELLLAGEQEQPRFPGYSRGLVAVLLYYDGRASLLSSLQLLIQARRGRTWSFEIEEDITDLATDFTDDLMKDGLTRKVLNLLERLDIVTELERLGKEKALGDAKHRHDVTEFLKGICVSLAESLFAWAAQTPLGREDTILLFNHLRRRAAVSQSGCLDEVTLALTMAFLYSIDISNLEPRQEDRDELCRDLPMMKDPQYLPEVHRLISKGLDVTTDSPTWKELKPLLEFGVGVMLRRATQHPETQDYQEILERDEILVETAIQSNVFRFINNGVFKNDHFFQVEFYMRQFHSLFTDFITQMPLKLKDLRNRGDEAGRIMLAHEREGLEPPDNLPRYFEDLLKLIGMLYGQDSIGLELSTEYWNAPDRAGSPQGRGSYLAPYVQKVQPKQLALFKFVRMAGDLLPPSLYVPYLEMLKGLSNGKQSANCCFNLLRMNSTGGGGSGRSISWDHFFASISRYYSTLRQDIRPESPYHHDPARASGVHGGNISPQELDGLVAVLQLTQSVAEWSEDVRIQLYENQTWLPTILLFGLLSCHVPLPLKGECLKTLAVFAKSPEIVMSLWQALETSQIIPTAAQPGAATIPGLLMDLEEVESRNEHYPMTIGFLQLMCALTRLSPPPPMLGAGYRAPGFDPYLSFLRDQVFLCFQARAYKDQSEKWQIASLVTEAFYQLLRDHRPETGDFIDQPVEVQGGGVAVANKAPGHHLMVHLLNSGDMLRMILSILDEAARLLNTYAPFSGKEHLQTSALNCLKLLDLALDKQAPFIDLLRGQGMTTPILATPMDQLLMGINPRSRKPDHLLNIMQLVLFSSSLAEHALYSLRVLYKVVRSSSIQPELVKLFSTEKSLFLKLMHGLVECLDTDEPERPDSEEDQLEQEEELSAEDSHSRHISEARLTILRLLILSLSQGGPNLAHLFLGYNTRKPVAKSEIQDPGIWGSPRTCLHAVLGILSRDLTPHRGPSNITTAPRLAELCYQVVYTLVADRETSGPTLRYLRGTRDYFYRHLRHVPFNKHSESPTEERLRLNQQAWLLKALAVELRITVINRQRSHIQRLIKLLLENTPSLFIEEDDESARGQSIALADQTALGFDNATDQDAVVQGLQIRRKVLAILDSIDFSLDLPGKLELEVIDSAMAEQVIASCETRDEQGVVLCDLRQLHRILTAELNNLQGSAALGQRPKLEEEVEVILRAAVERNHARLTLKSRRQAFDAWRQIVEVLLTSCPEEILPNEVRQKVTIELMQELLAKVLDEDASPELTSPIAGNLLSLTATLRQCVAFDQSQTGLTGRGPDHAVGSSNQSVVVATPASRGAFAQRDSVGLDVPIISLTGILRDILRFLLMSGGSHQLVRANLYGTLLNYLQIPQRPPNLINIKRSTMFFQPAGNEDYERVTASNLAVLEEFGDTLCSLVCRDACEGQEVGRTLALSLLSTVLTIDRRGGWLAFITSHGYLRHFIESIAQADQDLQEALQPSPEPLRAVYIYESTMSFLTIVAEDVVGAKALLQAGIMAKLAEVQFLDLRPEHELQSFPVQTAPSWDQYEQEESFVPTVMSRYRQLFFPVLRLCQAVLTSLGSQHKEALVEVLNLVVSHADVFTSILREPVVSFKLESLQELSLVTSILGTVLGGVDYFDPSLSEVSGPNQIPLQTHVTRLHRQLMALVPRYCPIENWLKELKLRATKRHRAHPQGALRQSLLEITGNLVGYCRAVIVRTGMTAADCQILFTPSMLEATGRGTTRGIDTAFANLDTSKPPSLGIVVRHLRQTSQEFLISLERLQQIQNKIENVTNLPIDEVKELALQSTTASNENVNTKQRLQLARKTLWKLVSETSLHLALLYYGLESSLFLVWRHLEYYFLHCHPSLVGSNAFPLLINRRPPRDLVDPLRSLLDDTVGSTGDQSALTPEVLGITKDDLHELKADATTCLNETLLKRILDIENTYGPMRRFRYAFVSAVVRRIRRLLIVEIK